MSSIILRAEPYDAIFSKPFILVCAPLLRVSEPPDAATGSKKKEIRFGTQEAQSSTAFYLRCCGVQGARSELADAASKLNLMSRCCRIHTACHSTQLQGFCSPRGLGFREQDDARDAVLAPAVFLQPRRRHCGQPFNHHAKHTSEARPGLGRGLCASRLAKDCRSESEGF